MRDAPAGANGAAAAGVDDADLRALVDHVLARLRVGPLQELSARVARLEAAAAAAGAAASRGPPGPRADGCAGLCSCGPVAPGVEGEHEATMKVDDWGEEAVREVPSSTASARAASAELAACVAAAASGESCGAASGLDERLASVELSIARVLESCGVPGGDSRVVTTGKAASTASQGTAAVADVAPPLWGFFMLRVTILSWTLLLAATAVISWGPEQDGWNQLKSYALSQFAHAQWPVCLHLLFVHFMITLDVPGTPWLSVLHLWLWCVTMSAANLLHFLATPTSVAALGLISYPIVGCVCHVVFLRLRSIVMLSVPVERRADRAADYLMRGAGLVAPIAFLSIESMACLEDGDISCNDLAFVNSFVELHAVVAFIMVCLAADTGTITPRKLLYLQIHPTEATAGLFFVFATFLAMGLYIFRETPAWEGKEEQLVPDPPKHVWAMLIAYIVCAVTGWMSMWCALRRRRTSAYLMMVHEGSIEATLPAAIDSIEMLPQSDGTPKPPF